MSQRDGALSPGGPAHRTALNSSTALRQMHPPLEWWRQLPADAFRPMDLPVLIRAMRNAGPIDHPRWQEALWGEPNSAIEIAVKTVFSAELTASADLALTAVLRCAISGDVRAAVVIAAALRKHATLDSRCRELESSWFVANCDDPCALWRPEEVDHSHADVARSTDQTPIEID
jgi:hypothetical protein